MHAELQAVREERDRLHCELVDSRAEIADYRESNSAATGPHDRPSSTGYLPILGAHPPHAGLSYQAPPPINTTFHELGTPTNAAQFASLTHFFPEADAEQERRLKRMEETIRALQANDVRPDARYGDCSLFPGMRLPPKFKAEDIPTWEDLSRKFTDQYRYCAEMPPTLLELSTKEMARGQKFEEYAAKWRAQAAKHIPLISEAQQIQLFHSTLRGVYYSHLLAHTSSFSDLIEARLDEDSLVPEIEESLRRLEDRQLTSLEPKEEINVGTKEEPRVLKIGTSLDPTQRVRMIDFLTRYQEVFAWSYADMPGLDPSIVKHFLPLDTEKFPPKRQQLRRQRAGLLLRIKEEVFNQINAGFLEVCNYSEWVANIMPVEKKDGRVRVCIDYRDLNKASPKDNFPLPHIDILVDNTPRPEYKLRLNPTKCTFGARSGKLLGFV
ncbi:hypothetical protein CRG98_039180, partial [Punica granatum]